MVADTDVGTNMLLITISTADDLLRNVNISDLE